MNEIIEMFFDELFVFLWGCEEKILKFIWKEKNVEIIGKYIEDFQSCYNTESRIAVLYDLPEIGYDAVAYKVLSKIDEDYLRQINIGIWDNDFLVIDISVYDYPDEVRNLDDEIIWTKENIQKEHKNIVDKVKKDLENKIKRGKEFFKYSDELEIIKKENLYKTKRLEELKRKIEERKEAGEKYAIYKRRLDEYLEKMKKYLRDNKYTY